MFGTDRERMGMRGVIIVFIENDGNIHTSHARVVYGVVMTVSVTINIDGHHDGGS